MARSRKSFGATVVAGLTVAAGAGAGYALSSSTMADVLAAGSSTYAKQYGNGSGVKGFALRLAPSALVGGATFIASKSMKGKLAAALILGGGLVAAAAPNVEDMFGTKLVAAVSDWKSGVGGPVANMPQYRKRARGMRRAASQMSAMMQSAGGNVQNLLPDAGGNVQNLGMRGLRMSRAA